MRFRYKYMILGTILVLISYTLSDPDLGIIQNLPIGAGTLATILILAKTVLYVAVLHMSRKALLDYLDLQTLFREAIQSSTGAGLAIVGVAIIMLSVAIVMVAAV